MPVSAIARALIVTAAIAILAVFLQAAAPIFAPILLAAFIALDASPQTRPIAILLGPEIAQETEPVK